MAVLGGAACVVGFVLAAIGIPAGFLVLVVGLVVIAPSVKQRRREDPMAPEPDTSWLTDDDD